MWSIPSGIGKCTLHRPRGTFILPPFQSFPSEIPNVWNFPSVIGAEWHSARAQSLLQPVIFKTLPQPQQVLSGVGTEMHSAQAQRPSCCLKSYFGVEPLGSDSGRKCVCGGEASAPPTTNPRGSPSPPPGPQRPTMRMIFRMPEGERKKSLSTMASRSRAPVSQPLPLASPSQAGRRLFLRQFGAASSPAAERLTQKEAPLSRMGFTPQRAHPPHEPTHA